MWNDIESLDHIHETQIDKELTWLERLASQGLDIVEGYSRIFGAPGCRPSALTIRCHFSAFIEYLESSFRKVVQGAYPLRNDRGLYVDCQLLTYLADSKLRFLTNERFGGEITKSPQRDRIVKPETIV